MKTALFGFEAMQYASATTSESGHEMDAWQAPPSPRPGTKAAHQEQGDSVARRELERLLQGSLPPNQTRQVRALLSDDLFRRREGLTDTQAGELGYERAAFVARALRLTAHEVHRDPRRLYAVHEWVALVDGVASTILSIHYCLALGSLVAHGEGCPELDGFVSELEEMRSVGVFLATELGYGNNVGSLETTALYDPERREFSLSSPTPNSWKFMPNTGHSLPKLAVVMARLISLGRNCGVFPFVVRIRDANGRCCEEIQITPLTEKPGYALDNAITRFNGVRIPKAHLLAGADSVLYDDGRFKSRIRGGHKRFLAAMDRVQTGRVCFTSATVAVMRASAWIAVRYTRQRLTFAPGKRGVPLLHYRNVQRDVFGGLASAYALTFAVRDVQEEFPLRTPATEEKCFRRVASLKAFATYETAASLSQLRERCGAAGMLSANRIIEYCNQVQGVITAEGDNQLMLLKVGRQLGALNDVTPDKPRVANARSMIEPSLALEWFRYREGRLREQLKINIEASLQRTRQPFLVWNENVNGTIELATAHAVVMVAECFCAALARAQDASAAHSLALLFSLWSLQQMTPHLAWYAAEDCVTQSTLKKFPHLHDRLCAELEPYAEELANSFTFDNTELQAPIAEDDYVQAYSTMVGRVNESEGTNCYQPRASSIVSP